MGINDGGGTEDESLRIWTGDANANRPQDLKNIALNSQKHVISSHFFLERGLSLPQWTPLFAPNKAFWVPLEFQPDLRLFAQAIIV